VKAIANLICKELRVGPKNVRMKGMRYEVNEWKTTLRLKDRWEVLIRFLKALGRMWHMFCLR
jgi:hypothetical protein